MPKSQQGTRGNMLHGILFVKLYVNVIVELMYLTHSRWRLSLEHYREVGL